MCWHTWGDPVTGPWSVDLYKLIIKPLIYLPLQGFFLVVSQAHLETLWPLERQGSPYKSINRALKTPSSSTHNASHLTFSSTRHVDDNNRGVLEPKYFFERMPDNDFQQVDRRMENDTTYTKTCWVGLFFSKRWVSLAACSQLECHVVGGFFVTLPSL